MSVWDPWWVHGDYADTYHTISAEDERRIENEPYEAKLEHEDELIEEEDLWVAAES